MAENTDLARLVVSLEARLDKFTKVMAKLTGDTDKNLGRVEKRFKDAESRISQFGTNINDRLTKALTIGAVSGFIGKVIKDIANLTNQAQKAGVSMSDLQKLIFAGVSTNTGVDQIVSGLEQFNKKIGEAATKGGDLKDLFDANGLSIRDQNGQIRGTIDLLSDVADLIKNARTSQEAMVIATLAGGRGWGEMLPLLKQGGAALRESMSGAVIASDDLINKFDAVDDKIGQMALNWRNGIAVEILTTVKEIGKIADLLDRLQKAMGLGGGDPLGGLANKLGAGAVHDRLFGGSGTQWPGRDRQEAGAAPGKPTIVPVTPEKATAETKAAAKAADDQANKITDVIQALKFQREQLSRTDREQEIYNELAKAGVDINSAAGKTIADLAGKFHDEQEALKDLTSNLDDARDATKGFFSDLIHGLKDGKTFTDALGEALSNLADKMLNRSLDMLFEALMGKSGGTDMGLLGQLLQIGGTTPGALPGVSRNPFDMMRGAVLPGVSRNPFDTMLAGPTAPIGAVTGGPLGGGGSAYGKYTDLIREAAGKYGLDPDLLAGLIKQESGFDPLAHSGAGAQGLTQLMPGKARGLGVTNPYDPRQSIMGGADYLRQQMDRFGNRDAALAAYNWGPGNVASKGMGNLPAETQNYIKQINANAAEFAQKFKPPLDNIAQTVQASGASFTPAFTSGLSSILSAVTSMIGGGGGLFGSVSGGLFGGGRADGGPVNANTSYVVGEKGPELFMPRIPGVVIANSGNGGSGGALAVHVTRSKLFEVEVARIAGRGDVRTLQIAKRHAPSHMARFQSLGTT